MVRSVDGGKLIGRVFPVGRPCQRKDVDRLHEYRPLCPVLNDLLDVDFRRHHRTSTSQVCRVART